jgi:very-short-patch-repair endonuclease
LQEALERGEVYVAEEKEKLDTRLVGLYRKARMDLLEGGSNTLFLALGFLIWKRKSTGWGGSKGKDERRFQAPLIMVPVELKRRSVRAGVRLTLLDDEPRFNSTLLEMLRQDFDLDITGLEGELPSDDSGIDVAGIWQRIRQEIKDLPGFEVNEEMALGTFSFAKYLMWQDLVERTDYLKKNPVVRHLIENPRDPYASTQAFPDPAKLDQDYDPAEIFTPLDSDSSQLASVIAAGAGKDFVIFGPPGSGKSQTIANMIAHLLGAGKTVLFASEKTAALNVVFRRLRDVGLGDFCLELHSNKARKMDVLQQFRAAWEAAERNPQRSWKKETERLLELRRELNDYVGRLNKVHGNGLSVHRAIGHALVENGLPKINLSYQRTDCHDRDAFAALCRQVQLLELNLGQVGDVVRHPLAMVGRDDWSNALQAELVARVEAVSRAATALGEPLAEFLTLVKLDIADPDLTTTTNLAEIARGLMAAHGKSVSFLFDEDAAGLITEAYRSTSNLREFRQLQATLSVSYGPDAWQDLALDDLEQRWQKANDTWWPRSALARRGVNNALIETGGAKAKPNAAADLAILQAMATLGEDISGQDGALQKIPAWAGFDSEPDAVDQVLSVADQIRQAVMALDWPPETVIALRQELKALLSEANDFLAPEASIGKKLSAFCDALAVLRQTLQAFAETAAIADGADGFVAASTVVEVTAIAEAFVANAAKLRDWCAWVSARRQAEAMGLQGLLAVAVAQAIPQGQFEAAFMAAYCRWWAAAMIDADDVLRGFNASLHGHTIAEFAELDAKLQKLTSRYVRAKVAAGIPDADDVTRASEYGIIKRELEKKRRHKPLRQLISEIPTALKAMKPCLLMSPLSIAQYLPPEQGDFDVVIFDEASQITVWDAVGALARGRQVIVVGDPKQLPPTNFFARAVEDEDDDLDDGDLESILDEMLGAGIPTWQLNWHYRSQNESLITFSNHKYYGGGLITFPAPQTDDAAVGFRKIEGVYEKGGARTNPAEAQAIVAEIMVRLRDESFINSGKTIGVVTFNAEQQRLVENLLDDERRQDPTLEPYFADDILEPLFVKNLESVQGDERDVILFSITYGADASGRVSMNFGPLNLDGGERRLNVAITRARSEMLVFSSITPDDIDLSRTSAVGVRDLKHFLDFARRGTRALGEAVHGPQGGAESPFESAIAAALEARGWRVQLQIGVSTFRIDLGIVHPDHPGRYLAGVECDGASYHRSATARDRDKLRQDILTRLGWRLLRVWSTDYWIDAGAEIDRIDAALREMLAEEGPPAPASEPAVDPAVDPEPEPED